MKDAKSGEELIGATVLVLGTSTGASVDFNGNFRIQNLNPGTYDVVVSFVSYQSDTLRGLTLAAGQDLKINHTLSQQSLQLDGVSVVATRVTNTEAAVLMEVKNSKLVMNAVSSEQIAKSQDSDASEVVRRVPGVTIIGNSYVMIRGLSERYNTVMLHDVFAPSMEADIKSFAFDILPSNLIDRMLIFKSPAAELPGEFAGGVVKIYTKSIPDERSTSVSLGTTFREGSSLQKFRQPKRGTGHQFGFNDGYNDLPSTFPDDIRKVNDLAPDGRLDQVGRSLDNNWLPEEVNSGMDRNFALSNASKFKLFGKDAGNITALSYTNSRTVFDVERADYNAYDNIGAPANGVQHPNNPRGNALKTDVETFDIAAWFNTPAFGNQLMDKWEDAGINASIFELGTPNVLPSGGSVLLSGANFTGLPAYFEQVSHRGAFGGSDWTQGWVDWNCALTPYN